MAAFQRKQLLWLFSYIVDLETEQVAIALKRMLAAALKSP